MRNVSRSSLLLITTLFLMFAFAIPAFAATGDAPYTLWSDVATMPGQGSSPHGGYATSTVKCSVCHAVHNAATVASSGAFPELLLADSVAEACNYCHVGGAGGYTQVYNGDPNNYAGTDLPNAHNSYDVLGVQQGVTCSTCHQVHGADLAMTANPYLTSKILRGAKTYSAFPTPNYDPIAKAPRSTDDSNTALTKWCAGCHFTRAGSYTYYANGYDQQSHVMTTATAGYSNPAASFSGKVAFKNSSYCSSCHSSQYTTAAWPHYTTGVRFLEAAEGATATASGAVTSGQDGICLRCHRQGLNGAGLSF